MLNEAGKYNGMTYAQMIKKIRQDDNERKKQKKAEEKAGTKSSSTEPKSEPVEVKDKPVKTTKKAKTVKDEPVKTTKKARDGLQMSGSTGLSGPIDPNDKDAIRTARMEKQIKNAIEDETPSEDPRSKIIASFAKTEMSKILTFIKKHFDLSKFDIKMTLVWDGAAAGITAGCDTSAKNPYIFFDFSRYLKYEGDLDQYKWTRPEYDEFSSSKVIGDLVKASWKDCVTASICHEASHALQYTKDIEVLQKIVDALPNYTGNGNDGAHGPLFQAIYTSIRGNIMGTKKESFQINSFSEYLKEVSKKEKNKELELSKPVGKHTDSSNVVASKNSK